MIVHRYIIERQISLYLIVSSSIWGSETGRNENLGCRIPTLTMEEEKTMDI
jgi:hypothetical protein